MRGGWWVVWVRRGWRGSGRLERYVVAIQDSGSGERECGILVHHERHLARENYDWVIGPVHCFRNYGEQIMLGYHGRPEEVFATVIVANRIRLLDDYCA